MSGIRPVGRNSRSKTGTCSLCGEDGPLTRAHVPPRAAGNMTQAAPMVTSADGGLDDLRLGRLRDGGTWVRELCRSCNSATGRYDEELARWWKALVLQWDLLRAQPIGTEAPFRLEDVRPGAFVRSVLAGMHALNRTLRSLWPELAHAVVTGGTTEAPSGLFLLLSLYTGDKRYVLGGPGVTKEVRLPNGTGGIIQPEAEIAWPPMHLVLVSESSRLPWPDSMDVLPWLQDAPDDTRDVAVRTVILGEGHLFMAEFGIPAEGA